MTLRLATLCLCLLATLSAHAEKADRNKPMLLEANRVSIDDAKKIQVLDGDVVITKGTLVLKAEHIVITEDQYGFQKGSAQGGKNGLARFRQKREGRDDYIEGEGERIEYNSNTEIAELFNRAWIKSGEDEIKGDYIWYDAVSEKYLVTAGQNQNAKAAPSRVRAIIQPKGKEAPVETAPTGPEKLRLKGDNKLEQAPPKP